MYILNNNSPKPKSKAVKGFLGLALMSWVSSSAFADEALDARRDALRQGFYVAPMLQRTSADSERQTDDGTGFALSLGYRWDIFSLELNAEASKLSREDGAGEAKLSDFNLYLLNAPFPDIPWARGLFGITGFGVHERQNHPGFAREQRSITVDAGLGYQWAFKAGETDLALRAELMHRLDTQQPPFEAGAPRKFNESVLRLGLQLPLGKAPALPSPEPVTVVEVVPAPAPVDDDADGVPNERDQCPDSAAGSAVNEQGCALPAAVEAEPTLQAGDVIVLPGVGFETASAELKEEPRRVLEDAARQLLAKPALAVQISGHTDSRGSEAYNQDLSERRAQSVRDYLVEHGVAAERLSAEGLGESQPADSNESEAGRARNRRVELKIVSQDHQGAAP